MLGNALLAHNGKRRGLQPTCRDWHIHEQPILRRIHSHNHARKAFRSRKRAADSYPGGHYATGSGTYVANRDRDLEDGQS